MMHVDKNLRQFTTEGTIDVPVVEVYRLVQMVELFPRWIPHVVDGQRLTEGPPLPGSRFVFHVEVLRFRLRLEGVVTEVIENKLLSFQSTSGPSLSGRWELWTDSAATRVQFSMEYILPGGAIGMAARLAGVDGVLAGAARQAFTNFTALARDLSMHRTSEDQRSLET